MILDIPIFKCFVDKMYVTDFTESGFVEAYCFAVTLINNRPLLFTVHTVHGAVFSRLPIDAIFTQVIGLDGRLTRSQLDPWGSIAENGQVIKHEYLKDYEVTRVGNPLLKGMYWATIDYLGGGFSEDPEQHKTSNLVMLDNGQLAAWPNNWCLFSDKHFTDQNEILPYRRSSEYYTLD